MYFGRFELEEVKEKKTLPHEWLEEFTKTLNTVYDQKLTDENRFFDVYGEIYEKEFVVIISYIHRQDQMAAPVSLFISHDNLEDSKKFKAALKDLVNLAGEIFDDIFSKEDWSDYNSNWTENKYHNSTFFYKITRENISLTLQAEALLNKDIEL